MYQPGLHGTPKVGDPPYALLDDLFHELAVDYIDAHEPVLAFDLMHIEGERGLYTHHQCLVALEWLVEAGHLVKDGIAYRLG